MPREIAPKAVMAGRWGWLREAASGEGLSVLTASPDPCHPTVATLMLSIVFAFSNIGIIIHPKWLPAHSARERSPRVGTMFLRQFQYLVAVAQEGHFGRAARSCHVSQPSLSSGIKQLELELGVPIFLRGRGQRFHGLTPEGERVARWARQVISDCSAMRDEIDAMQDNLRGSLRVGSMPSMSPVLPVLVQLVRQRHPGVVVDVQFIGSDAMKVGLNNFSLDVGITYMDTADLGRRSALPICTESLSLLVPDAEPFRKRTTISWKEAAELPLAMLRPSMHERRFVNQVFTRVGRQPV